MRNTLDKLKGRAKEVAGKVTGDKRMELKGKMEHDIAVIRQRAHDMTEDIDSRI